MSLLNARRLETPVYAVWREKATGPLAGTSAASGAQRIDQLLQRHGRIWLLTQGAGDGDPNSMTECYLARTAAIESTRWLAGGYRLSGFARLLPAVADAKPLAELGGVASSTADKSQAGPKRQRSRVASRSA